MHTPHDTLFHSVFRDPPHAATWVQSVLPRPLRQPIDWATFRPTHGSVKGLRLRSHHSDLVFRAELLGGSRLVLFVIEHKSGPDAGLHWQVLRYAVHLGHVTRRQQGELPLILPLALTHGGPPITTTLWPDLPVDVAAPFEPHQPKLMLLVDDLSATSEASLVARDLPALLRLTFLCLQHTRGRNPDELLAAIDRWRELLRAVERDADAMSADALDEIGWYLVDTTDLTEDQVRMAFHKHLDQPENTPMTTGQRIRLESRKLGREEGRTEGETKGKAQTLLRLMQRRFGAASEPFTPTILAASVPDLDRWFDRILDAKAVADVFAD